MSFTVYKDKRKKYRWRIVSDANKKIVGASSQGFATRSLAYSNAGLLFEGLCEAGFE